MLTELLPYGLSISRSQMPPDNGLPHVSLEVGIENTKHEGLFSFWYAAISLLIPSLNPISSIAAGEYPVGLDEGMGPEMTGSGPMGFGRCFGSKMSSTWLRYVDSILQVRRGGMGLL